MVVNKGDEAQKMLGAKKYSLITFHLEFKCEVIGGKNYFSLDWVLVLWDVKKT